MPERWLEDAARARERTRGELQDQTDFKVGVDLRVTWAAEQKKDQALVPLIAGCREKDRDASSSPEFASDPSDGSSSEACERWGQHSRQTCVCSWAAGLAK